MVGQVSTKGTVALRAIPKWRLNKTKMKRRRRILRVMAKNLKMHGIDDYRFIYFLDSFLMLVTIFLRFVEKHGSQN